MKNTILTRAGLTAAFFAAVLAVFVLGGCPNPAGAPDGNNDDDKGGSRVETPVANPPAGAVAPGDAVTLTTATEGADIYYTTDGSAPDSTKTKYETPISITAALTIKAVAVKEGMEDSEVLTAAYTVNANRAGMPVPEPRSGSVRAGTQVTLTTATEGADIYYTLDGSTPDKTKTEMKYTGPVTINGALTLKAIAVKEGMEDSMMLEAAYTVFTPERAAKPAASPGAGEVDSGTTVTLATATEGADIYYTTDGSAPDSTKTKYETPISITAAVTIKAVAVKEGLDDSEALEAAYTIVAPGTAATPSATPAPGDVPVAAGTEVTLSTTTAGADIYYTTDGSAPDSTKTKYAAGTPVTVTGAAGSTFTIKAIAVKAGLTNSGVLEAAYTIAATVLEKAAKPAASQEAGPVSSGAKVTLSTTTAGADIYYTTDGSAPDSTKTKYTGEITITANTAIKAVAVKAGMADSEVLEVSYTVAAAKPAANPAGGGSLFSGDTVTLSTTTAGADIYYTTDGSTPSSGAGTKYAAETKVTITGNPDSQVTLKAVAVKEGMTDSAILEAAYTIAVPLTADINFVNTENETNGEIIPDWEGDGTANQTWTMTVSEPFAGYVYFTAQKEAAQTIAVSGEDEALVTKAGNGATVDGSTAGDTLAVFTVDVRAAKLLFDGGDVNFTLEVSEPGKAPVAVAVNLAIAPDLSEGAAVYKVHDDDRLETQNPKYFEGTSIDDLPVEPPLEVIQSQRLTRISGIEHFDLTSLTFSEDTTANGLVDALAWIDRNAEDGAEYLVRVEQDESLPQIIISANFVNAVIRLRGYQQPRTLALDGATLKKTMLFHPDIYPASGNAYNTIAKKLDSIYSSGSNDGFVNVGHRGFSGTAQPKDSQNWGSNRVTLALEKNITLSGNNVASTAENSYKMLVRIGPYARLVMRSGSVLTGYTTTEPGFSTGNGGGIVIQMPSNVIVASFRIGKFIMTGGTITGNNVKSGVIYIWVSDTYLEQDGVKGGVQRNGGVIDGNSLNTIWRHVTQIPLSDQMYVP
jgi:hypothetical protein